MLSSIKPVKPECLKSPVSPKDIPVLFKGELVQAILNTYSSRTAINPAKPIKWQTRRLGQKNYQIGDRLWVRELLRLGDDGWYYDADKSPVLVSPEAEGAMLCWVHHKQTDYCPSIHMPRWACRLRLEITAVRIESLQEISCEDIQAEGVGVYEGEHLLSPNESALTQAVYRDQWIRLWDSINKSRGFGWEVNPSVTVIEFKREAT